MRLAEWRKQQGWTQAELAGELGCTQCFVSEMERAVAPKIPRRAWLLKIWSVTKGAVSPNDFYDLPSLEQIELPLEEPSAPLLDIAAAKARESADDQLQAAA